MLGHDKFDPLFQYYEHEGIQFLNRLAWFIDGLCLVFIIFQWLNVRWKLLDWVLLTVLFAGILLPWIELYLGSTFYYGEVRGMQQLPFLVNNFGVVGSTIFGLSLLSMLGLVATHPRILAASLIGVELGMGYIMGFVWNW